MPRKTNLIRLRANYSTEIDWLMKRFKDFERLLPANKYGRLRWVAAMSIVELHAIWERFAEDRLVIALNHSPGYFILENSIKGTDSISKGLSRVIVKGNAKYFDFKSMGDLIDRGNKLLGNTNNPFYHLKGTPVLKHLDALSAIRNSIVHRSDTSMKNYKKALNTAFNVKSAPEPEEFLNAKDFRVNSPLKGEKRIFVLAEVVQFVIKTI